MPKDKTSYQLKVPKGMKDWDGRDMVIRDKIFSTISEVFKRHGAVTIDTPVCELKEILAGKYGEDSKLIYDLQDQGGELCSLRYDLTVPFARWLAMNSSVQNIKRYHIAKVYRRDQPAMTKGRMREFYQCDFDIAGAYDPMLPDAEILRITTEIFEALGWKGHYTIKLNHRKILDGIFQVCGVPEDKLRSISSAVDKLDKLPWEEVKEEMTEEKGLDPVIADKIGEYVVLKGSTDLLKRLQDDANLSGNPSAKQGLEEMALLFDYLSLFNILPKISFDLSLARGLDYYTGVIYEVITEGSAPSTKPPTHSTKDTRLNSSQPLKPSKKPKANADDDRSSDPSIGVGSVAAGGRYDTLVGMFSGKGNIPCVGISFGVDRIFSITKSRLEASKTASPVRLTEVDVYVMAFGGGGFKGMLKERMKVVTTLWDAGIKAEFAHKVKPKLPKQFSDAEKGGTPFAVILGEEEQAVGKCKIKELGLPDGHPEKDGVKVNISDLVSEVRSRLRARAEAEEQARAPAEEPPQPDPAAALAEQNRYQDLEGLQREALAAQERRLGRTHEDTLDTRRDLASSLEAQGKTELAERTLAPVIEARKEALERDPKELLGEKMQELKVEAEQVKGKQAHRGEDGQPEFRDPLETSGRFPGDDGV